MKIKHTTILLVIICTVFMMISNCFGAFGTSLAKITVKVVGEDGNPIPDVRLGVGFRI
ncbi:MAG: hypothetical protein HY758_02320 [Nitrospirae bacterium]|nr:hypothetical protein [Nitrospirota bacterium]